MAKLKQPLQVLKVPVVASPFHSSKRLLFGSLFGGFAET